MSLNAFQPSVSPACGTLVIASTAASATAAQQMTGGFQSVRIVNMSTLDAYVAISASSGVTAAAPTTASSTGSMPMLQRTERAFSVPPNFWISAITTAGQANLAFTPGFGQ